MVFRKCSKGTRFMAWRGWAPPGQNSKINENSTIFSQIHVKNLIYTKFPKIFYFYKKKTILFGFNRWVPAKFPMNLLIRSDSLFLFDPRPTPTGTRVKNECSLAHSTFMENWLCIYRPQIMENYTNIIQRGTQVRNENWQLNMKYY